MIKSGEIKSKAVKSGVSKGDRSRGLTAAEVERSRLTYGENILPRAKKTGFWRKFLSNMGDPVIKILLVALAVNVIFMFRDSNPIESIGIAISIFLATFISTLSEQGSENAFEKLDAESRNEKCRVRRADSESGKVSVVELPFSEVVVGDTVLLSAGDKIAADGVLRFGRLGVDQSGLNGESREAEKRAGDDFRPELSALSSVFGGCTVLSGEGEMEVVRVGKESFLGGISTEIQNETRQSPLKLRLGKLARQISIFGYVAAFLCAVAYLVSALLIDPPDAISTRFVLMELLHAFTLGLTVVVMAVPEGLPMMIAVVLSSNIKRMVRDQVLVRKPVGIEAAGSMNILFTDKTGTLTEGKMRVGGIMLGDGSRVTVKTLVKDYPKIAELYGLFAKFGESAISNGHAIGGNATERALAESALAMGEPRGYRLSDRIPFDSSKKFSAVRLIGKSNLTLVKGAPEILMPYIRTAIFPDGREAEIAPSELTKILLSPAKSGWRILALCISTAPIVSGKLPDLCLVCSVMIADELRREAPCAVDELKRAGIQVVMITGDNRSTAIAVGEKCGIFHTGDLCLTSEELSNLSDSEIKKLLPKLRIVARALPSDKSRLVRLAQENGLVVGMTGDGVNDAPALKTADIGFAMGSGTSVAKEAGDIIILDNNLASIVKAVLYGRNIFKSIRKFIVLQLTINLCAVGVTMIGPFIAIESPVTVVQMLWINIVMDTLGGIAFAGEPALPSCMREKPKARDESILNRYMVNQIVCLGAMTVALCVFFLKSEWVTSRFSGGEGSIAHLTAFFAFFIFAGIFNCFNARTDSLRLFRGLSKNRVFIFVMLAVATIQIAFVYLGGSVLRTVPLLPSELVFTMGLAALVFPFELVRKIVWRLGGEKGGF